MREYERHVGSELERIALYIFPRGATHSESDQSSSDGDEDDDDSGDDRLLSIPSGLIKNRDERKMDVTEKLALSEATEGKEGKGKGNQATANEPRDFPERWRPGERYCLLHGKPEVPWTFDKLDPSKPFSCTSLCGATFKDKSQWMEHEEWNFPRSLWVCSWCADSFPKRSLLAQHQKDKHGRQRIDHVTDCLDLGPFQRDCFFECGFSANKFRNWIDHVACHVMESFQSPGIYDTMALASLLHRLGPQEALILIHRYNDDARMRDLISKEGIDFKAIEDGLITLYAAERDVAKQEAEEARWDEEYNRKKAAAHEAKRKKEEGEAAATQASLKEIEPQADEAELARPGVKASEEFLVNARATSTDPLAGIRSPDPFDEKSPLPTKRLQLERISNEAEREKRSKEELPLDLGTVPEISAMSSSEGVEKVVEQFRLFAEMKAQRRIEQRRLAIVAQASRMAELMDFKKRYNLRTPIPNDLLGILAKDSAKLNNSLSPAK